MSTPPVGEFLKNHPSISLSTFADAAKNASVIVLATLGHGAKEVWLRVYSATKNGFFNFEVATGK